jgi:hypothetical protein
MKFLKLDEIKDQCRIEQDFDLENTLLNAYGAAAENALLRICNRSYDDLLENFGENDGEGGKVVPADFRVAALMLAKHLYEHRGPTENVSVSMVPYALDLLIKPYMRLTSATDGDVQTVTLGSDVKIAFTADLPDGLLLKDVDFTVKVINMSEKDKDIEVPKADCIMTDEGASYVVLVDSETLGIGTLMLRLTVFIPDTDYQSGTRKEVIKINPHIRITG